MARLVQQQAMVMAYASTYWLMAVSFIAMMPLLLLIKPPRQTTIAPAPVGPE